MCHLVFILQDVFMLTVFLLTFASIKDLNHQFVLSFLAQKEISGSKYIRIYRYNYHAAHCIDAICFY